MILENKKILIFGEGSYIGNSFKEYIGNNKNYSIETINSMNEDWRKKDFSTYDVIYLVAGIAHVSADPKMEQLYYKVNRDLPIEVAKKAKSENVKQFIFMSSMIIYGADGKIGENRIINENTEKKPIDFYGKSKLEADEEIQKLSEEDFKTVIIRTPMVYGPNCKGNFPKLKKIAKISPFFPDIQNYKSMIYIDNLCEFLKQVIDKEERGIFYPQNKEYVSTKNIIKTMAECMGKKIFFIKFFNPLLKMLSRKINYINKVFGNKVYNKELSGDFSYCIVNFEESIRRSIKQ